MAVRRASLREVRLPEFGLPTAAPEISRAIHVARVAAALKRAKRKDLDALVVYGDREHSANMAYLTGHDPRFEEAVLILVPDRVPRLLIGNEGWGYAALAAGLFERVLYQPLSLMGQPRDKLEPLPLHFREAGLKPGMRIGAAGWKGFDEGNGRINPDWLEIPAWLADGLRKLAGRRGRVVNVADIFMNPRNGLRAINEVEQLAQFEYAATHTSEAVRRALLHAKPGMSELAVAESMRLNGLPWSVHLMLSGGERARVGLPSPSSRPLRRGDPFTVAFGIAGGLNCRAGFLVADGSELPAAIRDYVPRLVQPYFEAVVAWYETVGTGVTGGELYKAVETFVENPFFGVGLNPGHLLHLDEWVHSPISKGSKIALSSGMALQVDMIPATGTDYFTTNIEDGIALGDEKLRRSFAQSYPEAWTRIERRRAFMDEALGIRLKPEVLPFSNIPAWLPPFILSPGRAMSMAP
ncbi:MAG: M24 family metallopeptidase [Pseudomonadota bacterium]|nr:M24 family metallopeptidase [Pseudomonadota bacterium]